MIRARVLAAKLGEPLAWCGLVSRLAESSRFAAAQALFEAPARAGGFPRVRASAQRAPQPLPTKFTPTPAHSNIKPEIDRAFERLQA